MNMIENHMEQIALSSAAISELPFPAPKIFTNALLNCPDITNLIRDTEAHERALFTVSSPESESLRPPSRKSIFHDGTKSGFTPYSGLRPTTAVGRILGGDLLERIRQSEKNEGRDRKDVDVEALLKGAEKLCGVYPIPGAREKIDALRYRHSQLAASIDRYESIVANQAAELDRINRPRDGLSGEVDVALEITEEPSKAVFSLEDLKQEEQEVRDLEQRKKDLEERVSSMERDLGGLLR